MKNPIVFTLSMLALLVAGIFIGRTDWFKNLFTPNGNGNGIPLEGTACTTAQGETGVISGGTCIPTGGGGLPIGDAERVAPQNRQLTTVERIARGNSGY